MNRYLIGAILAGLVLLAMSGLQGINRLFADNSRMRSDLRAEDSSLGTLPIEQAGRIVRRQGQADSAGMPAAGTGTWGGSGSGGEDSFTSEGGAPRAIPNATIAPASPNEVSRTTPVGPTSTSGDIAPIESNLVRPGSVQPPTDPGLDSIPALW
ncbi:MAG TPA: hypothetical protein IGR64_01245 [Leptolyngbyaceae cyanobacterium M65_K2018_010]|nr:hypothetical protein [Leptolyngbyaceae cyanobacterium M65_K2018_010]